MKFLIYTFLLLSVFSHAQELNKSGVTMATTETDFNQAENYQKLKSFAEDYLVNENIKITKLDAGKSIHIQGAENHKACYINQKFATKNCFELQYDVVITAKDKAYTFEVKNLKATNESTHPGMSFPDWFDPSGNPIPVFKPCIDGTSEYFSAMNSDFKEFVEEGDYW